MQTSSEQQAHHVWMDASDHFGCGAVYRISLSWLQLPWPHPYRGQCISRKRASYCRSFYLSFLLVQCGGPSWRGSLVVVHSDNLGALAVVN